MKRNFLWTCVAWPPERLEALIALQDEASEIPLPDFVERVDEADWQDLLCNLGYTTAQSTGIRIEDDHHVRFHLHEPTGIPFMVHSAIEHVFAREEEIDRLHSRVEHEAMVDMEM